MSKALDPRRCCGFLGDMLIVLPKNLERIRAALSREDVLKRRSGLIYRWTTATEADQASLVMARKRAVTAGADRAVPS